MPDSEAIVKAKADPKWADFNWHPELPGRQCWACGGELQWWHAPRCPGCLTSGRGDVLGPPIIEPENPLDAPGLTPLS